MHLAPLISNLTPQIVAPATAGTTLQETVRAAVAELVPAHPGLCRLTPEQQQAYIKYTPANLVLSITNGDTAPFEEAVHKMDW